SDRSKRQPSSGLKSQHLVDSAASEKAHVRALTVSYSALMGLRPPPITQGRSRTGAEEADGRELCWLLRVPRERQCRRRAADQGDELAAPHSIPASARASSVAGTSIPITFAVCRLMMSSNLVARRIGISAGFSPLRTRPA